MNYSGNDYLGNVIDAFAVVASFLRKLYIVLYNCIAGILGNPTKVY